MLQFWAITFATVSIVCNLFIRWGANITSRKAHMDGDAFLLLFGVAIFSLVMSYGMVATMIVGD